LQLTDEHKAQGLPDFFEHAHEWCNSNLVPPEKRVPEFLRGLYWMKDLKLDDIAFCPSLGEWNATTRSLRLAVWTHFVFRRKKTGKLTNFARSFTRNKGEEDVPLIAKKAAWIPFVRKPLIYTITFSDDSFTYADIWTNSKVANTFIKFPLEEMTETDDKMIKKEKRGDIWNRPSFFGLGSLKFGAESQRYYAVRVMNDDGTVHRERYEMMKKAENDQTEEGENFVRYAHNCDRA